ncbi:MAG: hypothetical protein LBB13_02795 [Rickettsiales bacterium]|jgi:hypothetical protein|nr:hypothetical protein [Rickettsiales bacterium]
MQKIELSIGTNRALVEYQNESEKELLQKTAKELNIEYNKLTINFGRIDENILLFFLLMKIEIKLQKVSYFNVDEAMLGIFRSISRYVQERNGEKIKEALMVVSLVRKMELNRIDNGEAKNEDKVLVTIKRFSEEIKANIATIENNILLS